MHPIFHHSYLQGITPFVKQSHSHALRALCLAGKWKRQASWSFCLRIQLFRTPISNPKMKSILFSVIFEPVQNWMNQTKLASRTCRYRDRFRISSLSDMIWISVTMSNNVHTAQVCSGHCKSDAYISETSNRRIFTQASTYKLFLRKQSRTKFVSTFYSTKIYVNFGFSIQDQI